MRIACYGVRPLERSYFEKLNKYDYDLKLIPEYLNRENVKEAEDCDAVLVRGNCLCDRENLKKFRSYGISWVFTRSVGVDHYDLKAAEELGISVARVPNYSPYAVANLAFTLGVTLSRHVGEAAHQVHQQDFGMHPDYFATEFNRMKVGIYGAGKIGVAEARCGRAWALKFTPMTRSHPTSPSSTASSSLSTSCSRPATSSPFTFLTLKEKMIS